MEHSAIAAPATEALPLPTELMHRVEDLQSIGEFITCLADVIEETIDTLEDEAGKLMPGFKIIREWGTVHTLVALIKRQGEIVGTTSADFEREYCAARAQAVQS